LNFTTWSANNGLKWAALGYGHGFISRVMDASLLLVMAGRYLGTPPNLALWVSQRRNPNPNVEHETLTPSTTSVAGLQMGVNVQLNALINISKFWNH
jgi:hypothetical protein